MQILQHSEGRWLVEGSKGKEYHVKRFLAGQRWGGVDWNYWCDCPGSIYRGHCKHIEAVKLKLLQDNPTNQIVNLKTNPLHPLVSRAVKLQELRDLIDVADEERNNHDN